MKKTIAIIGGGAAGFFGAISAAEAFPEARVVLFEKSRNVLSKVRISGGGRCNVTNAAATIPDLLKGYPRGAKFLKNLFPRFSNQHTIEWFQSRGVPLKTEPDGRMFPASDYSETIVRCLQLQAKNAGVELHLSTAIKAIQKTEEGFRLTLNEGQIFQADRVLVTTGGHPQITGYDWLSELGIAITPPVPSLFTFNLPDSFTRDLSGISVNEALVRISSTKFQHEGPVLLTHWGLSGPAVLKLSAWAARELEENNYRFTCLVNWTNQKSEDARTALEAFKKLNSAKQLGTVAPFQIPNRLWRTLLAEVEISEQLRWVDLNGKPFNRLFEMLTNNAFEVQGKTTFKEEFVTCGGVTLSEINPKTLESKIVPGLFFAGEILDIDGITGGYNFQAAWTTAWIAGQSIGL
ncbi:NAD(P)/FAD-dependent oxidoreductase [Siphonobacter sp. SORGH_AS_1065]|uniref:NAD(P)/FAD-dependent oxidoreductase n=1 Tax=Siphonobacter sp. SORGH_AS_1065 TaxID=3041795 RepID=UPI00278B3A93|nr:NAD(P)/FAD-dependent oxidoreductase [Siphonobacter sp. SORGH_AS_1065]MDQ1087994.1 putative Rossmann fold flavoprotein [Siphonobacter sp. SORGH_AS_1065]